MTAVTLGTNDVPAPVPQEAAEFLHWWFRPGSLICVAEMQERKAPRHAYMTVEEFSQEASLLRWSRKNAPGFNVFHATGSQVEQRPEFRRPTGNILEVPGLWLDLDVKPGSFTRDGAREFIRSFPLMPSRIVMTGTGGLHPYWKLDQSLTVSEAKHALVALWSTAQELAGDIAIDKLTSVDRIMRTPGFVRWPKNLEESPALARLTDWEGPVVSLQEVRNVCGPAFLRHEDRVTGQRQRQQETQMRAQDLVQRIAGSGGGMWGALAARATMEDEFNEITTWEQVAEPHGWYLTGHVDADGRREWSYGRGSHERSATTDYAGSPVMSLLSDNPATGLLHLKEARIPITRYQFWVALTFGGDHEAFAVEWLRRKGYEV